MPFRLLFARIFIKAMIVSISDSLITAHENILRVIPKPLTADEEAQRAKTLAPLSNVDPAALHDAVQRFVDALRRTRTRPRNSNVAAPSALR